MRLSRLLASALLLLLVPMAALAVAPGNVTGITAAYENGRVRVGWRQVDEPITRYRVYYSAESILGNNGLYDDFETTDGSVNSHLLPTLPWQAVYVSVLAVNASGEESEYFVEEAFATTGQGGTSPVITGETMRMISAQAVSATGVLLKFSHAIETDSSLSAAQVISLTHGSGSFLEVVRMENQGSQLLVHTKPQRGETVYQAHVNRILGKKSNGTTLILDPSQSPLLFVGFRGTATEGTPTGSAGADDVRSLTASAVSEGGGLYTVDVRWAAPAAEISGYRVAQSVDNGRSYSPSFPVDSKTTAIRIARVPAGVLGIRVQSVFEDGSTSNGATHFITLKGGSKITGTMLPPKESKPLPQGTRIGTLPASGMGITAVLLLLSAACGAFLTRPRSIHG